MASARSWMSKGEGGGSKDSSRGFRRILHEAGRKGGGNLKDAVSPRAEGRGHLRECLIRKIAAAVELAPVREHRVEFCQGRCAADSAKGSNLQCAIFPSVHRADGMQSARGDKSFSGQSARRHEIAIKFLGCSGPP